MKEYSVRLESFEGPMGLLMHLIDKNKIDIYDIPIAELTEQYIEYLDQFREFNMDIASEFIVMAATLLQIKSRMMLPKPPKVSDEPEEDPRKELIARILEYRRFKQVSSVLEGMQEAQERSFAREPEDIPVKHLPPDNMSLDELIEAFSNVIAVRKELKIPEVLVEPEEYSIQDKMEELISRLNRAGGRILFSEAFDSGNKPELITTFLAMLELIKLRSITVRQGEQFTDIYISIRVGDNNVHE